MKKATVDRWYNRKVEPETPDDNPFVSNVSIEDGLVSVVSSLQNTANATQFNHQLDTIRSIADHLGDLVAQNKREYANLKEQLAWTERERDSWKKSAQAHENSTIERAKTITRLKATNAIAGDTDITNHCPQCQNISDAIRHINNLVLMLTDVARGDWQQYEYTSEGRDIVIDRIDDQITITWMHREIK